MIGKYRNIHTGEVYEYFLKDIRSEPTKSQKGTIIKNVPHIRLISDSIKPKEPFRVTEDFNKYNTFEKIQ